MKNLGINIVVCLGAAALASAVVMGTVPGDRSGSKGKQDELRPAIETLQKQLMRRFTERTNVDFGFSRVVRPKSRMHFGPTMEKSGPAPDIKNGAHGMTAMDPSGNWRKLTQYRDEMHAENDDEKTAIQAFLASHRDVGIYTYGMFDAADSSTRVKGPAILNQFADTPPVASTLTGFATRAWRSGGTSYHELLNGYDLYATRVTAVDQTCVDCHQSMIGTGTASAGFKLNAPVGLFVIAVAQPISPLARKGS